MALYSASIQNLIQALSKLPGVGRKSAQKLAFHILEMDPAEAKFLSDSIIQAREKVHFCSLCCNLTESDPCEICSDAKRDSSIICVVGEPKDIVAIEKTKEYKGLYHVLGGLISPMEDIGPADLNVKELLERLKGENGAKEVILATNLTVEGRPQLFTWQNSSRLWASKSLALPRVCPAEPIWNTPTQPPSPAPSICAKKCEKSLK